MRPHGSPKSLEERRRKVMEFLNQDLSLHEIARRIGCHASSVMRWRDTLLYGGQEALKAKAASGRPPRLTSEQKTRLVRFLIQGALAHGFRTELWTTQRIADLIERRWGIRYHRSHVARLLNQIGWKHHKPERGAIERDGVAVKETKRSVWHSEKKTPQGWQRISSSSPDRDPEDQGST
jgi:transposase